MAKREAKATAAAAAKAQLQKRKSPLDCSQPEPHDAQDDRREEYEAKRPKQTEGQDQPQNKAKRKNVSTLIKEISKEVHKTKVAKTGEYQARLDDRTAKPPAKTIIRASTAPPPASTGSGYEGIHPSHVRASLNGEIIFCWRCGYWMRNKSQKLKLRCDITALSSHQRSMRDNKLHQGLYPQAADGPIKKWRDGASTAVKVPIERLDPP